MRLVKLILLVAIVMGSYKLWVNDKVEDVAASDLYGFVPVVMPANIRGSAIIIFTPENCTHEEAARADELSEQLSERGIHNKQESHYEANFTDHTQIEIQNTNSVMRGKIPVVLFNGYGKSNPSVDDVLGIFDNWLKEE